MFVCIWLCLCFKNCTKTNQCSWFYMSSTVIFSRFHGQKGEKKQTSYRIPTKKHVPSVCLSQKNNRHGNLRVLYPTPNPNPTQVPRYPRWPLVDSKHGNKKTEGWNLLEEIRKGVSDEALVSQVAEAVQRCRHGRRCEGHYSYIYTYVIYIYIERV